MYRRVGPLLAAFLAITACPVLAQLPRVPQDRGERARVTPLQPRCWERGPARGPDYIAEHNAEYRELFARYVLEPAEDGWYWYPRRLAEARNLRPAGVIEGLADTELRVRLLPGEPGRAEYRVDGSMYAGTVRLEWSEPPKAICADDRLDMSVGARIVDGDPGDHRIGLVLPLSEEQRAATGSDVRACSPGDLVIVDSVSGVHEDEARCRRSLDHLPAGAAWTLLVTLPDSFYVVYRYQPR